MNEKDRFKQSILRVFQDFGLIKSNNGEKKVDHRYDFIRAAEIILSIPHEEWQSAGFAMDGNTIEAIYYGIRQYHPDINMDVRVLHFVGGEEIDIAITPNDPTEFLELFKQLQKGKIKKSDEIRLVTGEQFEILQDIIHQVFKIHNDRYWENCFMGNKKDPSICY